MRLVVDTNVVVSAFLWQGTPGRLLEMAGEKQVRLFASRALLDELADVLGRKKLAKRVAATGLTVPQMLAGLSQGDHAGDGTAIAAAGFTGRRRRCSARRRQGRQGRTDRVGGSQASAQPQALRGHPYRDRRPSRGNGGGRIAKRTNTRR